ncbi:ribonuclease domain-containing protein [Acidaminobacter sp.]|uniref:ribonuclease domain-containing protein n=1 Tax=Acidaminobacter sp. TaxID=1872102 RepID=UPI0013851F3E|nr:ribonuclease domain-containing protein [Acidaminobacter sp.]MDK9710608.1 ribonuclease [Acidaminobacter sp.]MZQ96780.1 ribonuclease [Acidaminobacter sp.]
MKWTWLAVWLLMFMLVLSGCGGAPLTTEPESEAPEAVEQPAETEIETEGEAVEETPAPLTELEALLAEAESYVEEGGRYTAPEDVAAYLHLFNELPENFITKRKAADLGWESNKGNLWDVTDEMSIGGDNFGNREGRLPDQDSRRWYECDVSYEGGYRGAERLVYSNDGLIFYTDDHYETFIQFY